MISKIKKMEEKKSNSNILINIKNKVIFKIISGFLRKNKLMNIIRYNKQIQKKFNINIDSYKKEAKIEIEIKLENRFNTFIKMLNENCHIYINETKIERIKFYPELNENETIKIVIDHNTISLCGLFKDMNFIKKIKFTKFNRKDIEDMSFMFNGCSILEELDLSRIYTNNVKDMRGMFYKCSSLKELNITNFNTEKVKDMSYMFCECTSLKELNLSNFNIKNVSYINYMFYKCLSLEKLDLSNFNFGKETYIYDLFSECTSLKTIKIPIINDNEKKPKNMFSFGSNELMDKIKNN